MTKTTIRRMLSVILCAALAWTVAFGITGCSDNKTAETPQTQETTAAAGTTADTTADTTAEADDSAATDVGEGKSSFVFTVVTEDKELTYNVKTDKATVGEALLELGLIEGEEGQYGLYVKKVCGILADYDVDGTYWAFYENGGYAMAGVDSTEITDGSTYSFKVEK